MEVNMATALRLTDDEKRMLDGGEGSLKQKALELIVRYACVLGAEELCVVTKAHLHCGAHHYLKVIQSEDIDRVISEMYFCSQIALPMDKMSCECMADVGATCPIGWQEMGVSKEDFEKDQAFLNRFAAAGVNLFGSCVPYLLGFIPLMGEHYVTSESHVVLIANSVFGACGNSDGIEAGFCAAVTGRTPLWGNHIMSNRKGTHVFNIDCSVETTADWDILGYTLGGKLPPHSVPVLTGKFPRPNIYNLKAAYASMATTSGPEMCHIIGITPEALTMEQALGGQAPREVITITDQDIEETRATFSTEGFVDYISLGCPHYAVEEIRQVADFLDGKRISANVILHVWTSYAFKVTADRCGYTEKIEQAGGHILTSSCPSCHNTLPGRVSSPATDSAKMAHDFIQKGYQNNFYGSKYDCLKAAISGKWEVGHHGR
jgi:predicted aconitase